MPTRITGTPTSTSTPKSSTSMSTGMAVPGEKGRDDETVDRAEIRAYRGDPAGGDVPQRLPAGRPASVPASLRGRPDPAEDGPPRRVPAPPGARTFLGLDRRPRVGHHALLPPRK